MITASLKLLVRISLMLEGLVIDLEHVLDIRVYGQCERVGINCRRALSYRMALQRKTYVGVARL
jgi:hypothetical protein